jgi:hypothetical protein
MPLDRQKPRLGRVKRAIRRAFIVDPDRLWSSAELLEEWTHFRVAQGNTSLWRRQHWLSAIRTAADRLGYERAGFAKTGRQGRPAILWRLKDKPHD